MEVHDGNVKNNKLFARLTPSVEGEKKKTFRTGNVIQIVHKIFSFSPRCRRLEATSQHPKKRTSKCK
jgi:hypothetical protein